MEEVAVIGIPFVILGSFLSIAEQGLLEISEIFND